MSTMTMTSNNIQVFILASSLERGLPFPQHKVACPVALHLSSMAFQKISFYLSVNILLISLLASFLSISSIKCKLLEGRSLLSVLFTTVTPVPKNLPVLLMTRDTEVHKEQGIYPRLHSK